MPLWFVRGLRRGVVTTSYPARSDPSGRTLPTPPAFRPDALTHEIADRLVEICPSHALAHRAGVLLFDVGKCTACGRCRESEPGVATASGEFELAVTRRSALVKPIPVAGEVSE
jgi:hypothetical protein